MITAKTLQELLEVDDNVSILHGYTFDRKTIYVFFQEGRLVKVEEDYGIVERWEESMFVMPIFFNENVKRWYKNGTDPTLREIVDSFVPNGLSETNGGKFPCGSPVYFEQPKGTPDNKYFIRYS